LLLLNFDNIQWHYEYYTHVFF